MVRVFALPCGNENMKIKLIAIVCLVLSALFFLTSCEAVDELTGKGVWGWLGIENPFMESTETAEPTVEPVVTPSIPSTVEPTADTETSSMPTLPPAIPTGTIPNYPGYKELIEKITSADFAKKPLMVACPTDSYVLTRQNAETVNSIISYVNQRFNSYLFINPQDVDVITANLINSAENGEYAADLLYIPLPLAMEYAKQGLLAEIDINRLSGESGCYDTDINSAVLVDGKSYAISSSITAAYENNVVIYLNTDLLERLDIELDVYKSVEEKEWTWEMIYMICSAAQEKIEKGETGNMDFEISGSVWDENKTKTLLFSSSGMQLSLPDKYGTEKPDFQKDSYPEFLAELSVFMNSGEFLTGDTAKEAFYKGELLMMVGSVGEVRENYHSYDSFAVLPMPLVDSHQENYVTVCDPEDIYVFAIPQNSENASTVLFLLDVMSYGSKYCFKYEFIESLYSIYIRQSRSIPFLGINSYDRFVPRVLAFGDEKLLEEIGNLICP